MKIQGRNIGADHPPLVIAEIGINHNGDIAIAKQMVDAAIQSGAEMIKHQTHIVEAEMSKLAKKVIPGNTVESIYEIMEKCSLNEEDETELKNYVESKGAIFISTPFSKEAADRLERMNVTAYKIGSGECNNYPLIEYVAKFGKPMIVSTGMNSIESVIPTVEILEKYNIDYALLHCTNLYPTPPHLIRLGGMQALMEKFPNAEIGLSDHSLNNNACLAAVALGATILERHFTDSMYRVGPDIICSMDPVAMQELIHNGNEIAQMRGGTKEASQEEQVTIDFAFATVVTTKAIKKGDVFTRENIWVKRPGTGEILAKDFDDLIGKTATMDIEDDVHLINEHVS